MLKNVVGFVESSRNNSCSGAVTWAHSSEENSFNTASKHIVLQYEILLYYYSIIHSTWKNKAWAIGANSTTLLQ